MMSLRFMTILLALGILLTGCGGTSPTPTPASTPTPSAHSERDVVNAVSAWIAQQHPAEGWKRTIPGWIVGNRGRWSLQYYVAGDLWEVRFDYYYSPSKNLVWPERVTDAPPDLQRETLVWVVEEPSLRVLLHSDPRPLFAEGPET